MSVPVSNAEKIRRLPWWLGAMATNMVFCYLCFAGPMFLLYLDALGLSKSQIGLVLSLFPFCGLVAPLVAAFVSRTGFKRTFIGAWGVRTGIVLLMVAAPWVLQVWGTQTTFIYVFCVLLVFAICRAIGETAMRPWAQEFIPDSIRGKFSAVEYIAIVLVGAITVGVISRLIGGGMPAKGFAPFVAVGALFGAASLWMSSMLPGGEPDPGADGNSVQRWMFDALRDRQFLLFMGAMSLVSLGAMPTASFAPLFMKERVGLLPGNVVLLESAALLAGLCSSFLWGWAADRYGSKPVLVTALAMLLVYPVGLLLIPRHNEWGLPLAMGLSFYTGLINPGWTIGMGRHLLVRIVPVEKKSGYLAVFTAWAGLAAGFGPLLGGPILEMGRALEYRLLFLHIDAYTPLFLNHLLLLGLAAVLFGRMPAAGSMPVTRFAGMFLQGNPIAAVQSLITYSFVSAEPARVSIVERLGQARSRLSVEELIEALEDPSFNVRLEAVVSIARTVPDERLTEALIRVLRGDEPDLAVMAAWALGRVGDRRAVPVLRELLTSGYPLLAAHSARALGTLGDQGVVPLLLARFRDELDDGLRVAYAAALGALRAPAALEEMLAFLRAAPGEAARRELTLALARTVGDERYIIRLWRRLQPEPGTTLSRAVLALHRRADRMDLFPLAALMSIDRAAQALGNHQMTRAAQILAEMLHTLPLQRFSPSAGAILRRCAEAMAIHGQERLEYVLLTLHTLDAELEAAEQRPPGDLDLAH